MPRVLIVDDSLIVRRNMQKFLTKLNFEVIGEAKNGIEAIEMCIRHAPDLITMDITMPDMDGITAVRKIREFDKNVRIVMSTSHGQERMVLDSIKAGARGYILKPINEEKVVNTLKKVFPLHRFIDENSCQNINDTPTEDIHEIDITDVSGNSDSI